MRPGFKHKKLSMGKEQTKTWCNSRGVTQHFTATKALCVSTATTGCSSGQKMMMRVLVSATCHLYGQFQALHELLRHFCKRCSVSYQEAHSLFCLGCQGALLCEFAKLLLCTCCLYATDVLCGHICRACILQMWSTAMGVEQQLSVNMVIAWPLGFGMSAYSEIK